MVIMGLGLTVIEGLSGELVPPATVAAYRLVPRAEAIAADRFVEQYALFFRREHRWEIASMVNSCALAIFCIALQRSGASSDAWLISWVCVLVVLVPIQTVALFKVVVAHNRHLRKVGIAAPQVMLGSAKAISPAPA
eukprot:1295695-Prymnesium_polylepis.1